MRTSCAVILFLSGLFFLHPAGAAIQDDDPLSPEAARVEAWWLVSVFRFSEARKILSSLEGADKGELDLIDALEESAMTLMDILVERGKGITLKLKSGEVVKGKPVDFTIDNEIHLHNKKVVPLSNVSWFSIASLGRSAAGRKGPESNALTVAAYLLAGEGSKTKGFLRKMGGPHEEAVRKFSEAWPEMEKEFTARALAGMILEGDTGSYRKAANELRAGFRKTEVYARLKERLREALLPLLRESGEIDAGLHPIKDEDLGGGRRKLVYGFVSPEESRDWQLLSFEEATDDIFSGIREMVVNICNQEAEEKGVEVMDVEAKPRIEDDTLTLPPGSAVRHRLHFTGDIRVYAKIDRPHSGIALPYAIVHGGKKHYLFAFYWRILARLPGGKIIEPEIERGDQYTVKGRTVKLIIDVRKSRDGNEASLVYEADDVGKVNADGVEEGYLVIGVAGAFPTTISSITIEGRIKPETLEKLTEARLQDEVENIIP